tara:strand:+ start:345 stop:1412 length:1068 start_codon:yes stop_codon:yes gene_type:complete
MSENIKKLITSFEFASIANVIFSGIFLEGQLNELKISKNNYKIEKFNSDYQRIVNISDFKIKENDVIFSRTEDLQALFYSLKNIELKNLKLITHQSDKSVNEKIYKKKPPCISKWYSVNVDTLKDNLIPIPIGISNKHPKNLSSEDFGEIMNPREMFLKEKKDIELLYVNFQKSTNFIERSGIYKYFENFDWALVQEPNQNKSTYLKNLKSTYFTIAPFGNGFDTHRFWEALYCGSIPVVKKQKTYKYAENLPVLFVNNYDEITKEKLLQKLDDVRKSNIEFNKLFFQYWKELIISEKIKINNSILVNNSNLVRKFYEFRYQTTTRLHSYKKILSYYLKKLNKLFFKSDFTVFKK